MQAWQIEDNFGINNLRLKEQQRKPLGPYDVLVKVKACSLNYRDYLVILGKYNPKQPLPLIPVSDGAGEVVEVGDKVSNFKPKDRVCATFSQDWSHGIVGDKGIKSTLGSPLPGMLQREIVLKETGLISFPSHLSFVEASTLPCAAVTAFNALYLQQNLNKEDYVLIEGSGGVAIFALQFAKIYGLKTIVLTSSEEKSKKLFELGADLVLNYKNNSKWPLEVLHITQNQGVSGILEVVGGDNLNNALKVIKKGGVIWLIGILAGSIAEIDLRKILMNQVRIQGIFVGPKTAFIAMNRVIEHSHLRPVIDKVFPFDKAVEAFKYLASQKHFGKVCIEIED